MIQCTYETHGWEWNQLNPYSYMSIQSTFWTLMHVLLKKLNLILLNFSSGCVRHIILSFVVLKMGLHAMNLNLEELRISSSRSPKPYCIDIILWDRKKNVFLVKWECYWHHLGAGRGNNILSVLKYLWFSGQLTLAGHQVLTKPLYYSSSTEQREKNTMKKIMGWEKDREITITQLLP